MGSRKQNYSQLLTVQQHLLMSLAWMWVPSGRRSPFRGTRTVNRPCRVWMAHPSKCRAGQETKPVRIQNCIWGREVAGSLTPQNFGLNISYFSENMSASLATP